jgi:hypothetical protein
MTGNGIFLVVLMIATFLLITGVILKRTNVLRRMIHSIASQYVRDQRTGWAENALLASLQFGLITLKDRNDMAKEFNLSLAPDIVASQQKEYQRKQLSDNELKVIRQKVAMIRCMPGPKQITIIFTLLVENMKLTAEVNDHRTELGYLIMETHE